MKRNLYIGVCFLFGLLSVSTPCLFGENYLGATAVLDKASKKPPTVTSAKPSPIAQLKADIESFKKKSASLAPDEAAQQWLKLLDEQLNLPAQELQGGLADVQEQASFNPKALWNALPPPPAWGALRKAIEARAPSKDHPARELCLQLVAHTLTVDRQAQTNDLARMNALVANMGEDQSTALIGVLGQISERMLEGSGDPDVVLKSLERRLTMQEEASQLSVPNLVPLVGEQKAEAFFRHTFSTTAVEVSIAQGEETKKLARKIALEMAGELKSPQWDLACSLDGGPLFEALEKKFAPASADTNQPAASVTMDILTMRQRAQRLQGSGYPLARVFYLLSLISQNRTKEAAALAQKLSRDGSDELPSEALKQLERAGYAKALHDFFYEMLSQNPELPFWNEYISLAAEVGETDKMLELARSAAARTDLNGKRRDAIQQNLYKALLAADHVEEGVAEIQQILSQPLKVRRDYDFATDSHGQLGLTLAKIGQLVGNTNWLEQGIGAAREELKQSGGPNAVLADYYSSTLRKSLATFLVSIGRGPEAEAILSDGLAAAMAAQTIQDQTYSWGDPASRICLAGLASIYYQAGRYNDVLVLLEKAPGWEAGDLADIHETDLDNVHQHEDSLEDLLRYNAAGSLLELGRKEEAARIANAILDENGGYDPAYEVLLKTGETNLITRLDELFTRDQFEERPLIWKAVLLKQNGKLEEAEAAARRAISIDPSDGEQGPGRRMRAYAVLADIRQARGDDKEAENLRGAVAAIRESETADRYYGAGLLKQSVGMYEDSLLKFNDAYCIQSRLALRLAEMGKHDEAAEHFRRAYELMPDSFGRVESHCFGCEGAFEGQQAQSIADKVFTALAKSDPQKPQVHYLLGYLREEQGNYADALAQFREAVKLDPDYLNAWKHVESAGQQYYLSPTDRDAIIFNMLRLDPLGRHGGRSGFGEVTDLPALWKAVEAAGRLQPQLAKTLYSLPASKAAMDQLSQRLKEMRERIELESSDEFTTGAIEPATAVMQNAIISATLPVFEGQMGMVE